MKMQSVGPFVTYVPYASVPFKHLMYQFSMFYPLQLYFKKIGHFQRLLMRTHDSNAFKHNSGNVSEIRSITNWILSKLCLPHTICIRLKLNFEFLFHYLVYFPHVLESVVNPGIFITYTESVFPYF